MSKTVAVRKMKTETGSMATGRGKNSRDHGKICAFAQRFALGAALVLAPALTAAPVFAQQATNAAFQPVKFVNNQAITGFELSQRMAFLKLLGFNGDLRGEAMSGLIDDRLRNTAAKQLGIALSSDAVLAGMEEFAARGSLNAEGFLQAIGNEGIAPETFRDFVSSGLVWREVVKARYADKVTISEAAIDRALTNLTTAEAQTVTLAEIALDASGGNRNQALALARDLQIDFIKGREFSAAARAVSVGATARSGGALGAKLLAELPSEIAVLVRSLQPGQISTPIILDDKLYIYQLIASGAQPVAQTGAQVIDFAEVTLPSTGDAAGHIAEMRRNVDSCDDLYAYATPARGMAVVRRDGASGAVSGVLQSLDAGEFSGPIAAGAGRIAVMLCARGINPLQTASRDEVALNLKSQRLAALADVYLSELRSDALIRDP